MKFEEMSEIEMMNTYCGEAITLTAVMAIISIAVMAVVVYRLFRSSKGGITVPGGWKFSWD